ncbi:MAG: phenylacetate-CoA oxygenase subunit PaaC [Ktedonobacteraceae bacterium]|nr:phenylacetate-CoA oxygenase subunit PaaC [Ktedonobacteraceae bacterium]
MRHEIAGPQAVPQELRQPLIELLQSLADDEFVLGFWDSEWTGVAPLLEEDVACSSIAQDEIGHARLYYQRLSDLTGLSPDQLAYGRGPEEYRQAQLVERRRGDWAFTIARQFLYDTADQLRLEMLAGSTYLPLAQDVRKMQREETYHQMHFSAWMQRLANGTAEARRRLEDALQSLWPDALGQFESLPGEERLLHTGVLTHSSSDLQQQWLAALAPFFARLRLPFPAVGDPSSEGEIVVYTPTIAARTGGRRGQHTQDFIDLWEQMTMVYRIEPQARW